MKKSNEQAESKPCTIHGVGRCMATYQALNFNRRTDRKN